MNGVPEYVLSIILKTWGYAFKMESTDVIEHIKSEQSEPEAEHQEGSVVIQIGGKTIVPTLNKRGRVITDPSKQVRTQAQLEALAKGREALRVARQDPNYVSKAGRKLGIKMTVEDQLKVREERNLKRVEKQRQREQQREQVLTEAHSMIEKTEQERQELEAIRVEEMARIEAIRVYKQQQAEFLEQEKKRIASESDTSKVEKREKKQAVILTHIEERIKSAMEEIDSKRKLEKESRRLEKQREKAQKSIDKHAPFVFDKSRSSEPPRAWSGLTVQKPFILRGRECDSEFF